MRGWPKGKSRKEVVGYAAAHYRMGSANTHVCARCGEQAQEWAYKGGCPNELTQTVRKWELKYSLDPGFYEPLCSSCHITQDHSRGVSWYAAKLTEDQVRALRAEYAAGGISQAKLALKYGVSAVAVQRIVTGRTYKNVQ